MVLSESDTDGPRRATMAWCVKYLLAQAADELLCCRKFVADALAADDSRSSDADVKGIVEFLQHSAPANDLGKYLHGSALYTLVAAEQARRLIPGGHPPIHDELSWCVSQWEAGATCGTQAPPFFGAEIPEDVFSSVETISAPLVSHVPHPQVVEDCAQYLVLWATVFQGHYYRCEDEGVSGEWMHMYLTYHELSDKLREHCVEGRVRVACGAPRHQEWASRAGRF